MNVNLKSFLLTVTAVLFWSTAATAFKLTLEGMNTIQLLFYSAIVSTAILSIILFFNSPSQIKKVLEKKYLAKNLLLGLINPFIYYIVVLNAYDMLPAQEAMILNYTWPINITVLSILFLGQKLNFRIIIGLLLAFIGVVIIATRGNIFSLQFHNTWGVILALGSSYIWAIYWILNLKDGRSELEKLFAAFFYGTMYIFIYVLLFDSFILENYFYLFGAVYVGLFEMGITFFLWLKGLQLSSNKAKTATLVYISPFFSIIFIALILNEKIFLSSLVGLFLIIVGILFQHIHIISGKVKFKI